MTSSLPSFEGLLTGKSALAGVLGWPVSHSKSPQVQGYWLREHGIDGAYLPLPCPPDRFSEVVRALQTLQFKGANVTVPHKEAAFSIADRRSERAERMGAANTLIFCEDGTIEADNTDGFGFIENLRQGAPDWQPETGPAVVLGAGGAARGVIAALQDAGVPEIILANRTEARALALADDLTLSDKAKISVVAMSQLSRVLGDSALLINTTSLGMTGQPPLEIDLTPMPSDALVTDIVYAPLETDLLAQARARDLAAVDGLGMLLHQARPGFEAWFGMAPKVTPALRAFVLGL